MPIAKPTALDAELLVEIFQTDLIQESLPNDIFDRQSGKVIYEGGKKQASLPDAMYLKLDANADIGRSVKVPMLKELYEDPTLGSDGDLRGNEEEPEEKLFEHHYTDIAHGTTNQSYGVLARDKIPYGIFEQRVHLLGRYFQQYLPVLRRQGLLEGISENLEQAPHYLTTSFCPNFYIPGLDFSDQPTYALDADTWVDNLVDGMNTAGTGSDTYASIRMIQLIEEYCRDVWLLDPLEDESGQYFTMTVPTPIATWLRNLEQANTPGAIAADRMQWSPESKFKFPNFMMQIGMMRLVEDTRYPTLTLGGSASGSDLTGYTMEAQYRRMGNADDGSSDPRDKTASARLVTFILGKHALCEWMPEGFHWEWDYQEYDKFYGSGVFLSMGVKGVRFNKGTATTAGMECRGHAVVPWTLPPRT